MRLLHPRHADAGPRVPGPVPDPSPAEVREASPATCAAAPVTSPSPRPRSSAAARIQAAGGVRLVTATDHAGAPPVRDHSGKRRLVGQSIRRVEDPKFLLGRGGYIADRITPGTLHAAVLRSPHPHARIGRIDTAQALAAPGVRALITGREAAELCGPMPTSGPTRPSTPGAAWPRRRSGTSARASRRSSRTAGTWPRTRWSPSRSRTSRCRDHRPGAGAGRRVAAGARGPGVQLRLRAQPRLRRRRARLRRGRRSDQRPAPLAPFGRAPLETVGAIAEYGLGTDSFTIDTDTPSFTSYLFIAAPRSRCRSTSSTSGRCLLRFAPSSSPQPGSSRGCAPARPPGSGLPGGPDR